MVDQPKDPMFDAVLELAKVHLLNAFDEFKTDVRLPWQQMQWERAEGSTSSLDRRAEGVAEAP
jgi:hypothetical protein